MSVCLFVIIATSIHAGQLYGQLSDFRNRDFRKADSIAGLYPKHPITDLKVLSEKLTASLDTDVEKFRSIFKWVCTNIDNDFRLYVESKTMREKFNGDRLAAWEKKFSTRVFGTLVEEHKTVCTGYAYLVRELAFHAGVRCNIVDGYGRNVQANIGGKGIANHSWNAVQLNNKWYLSDPTWASGSVDPRQEKFVPKFDDAYFLVEPELFIRNHYPLDTALMFVDNKPSLNHFLNGPIVYTSSFRYNIKSLGPDQLDIRIARGTIASITFSTRDNSNSKKMELYVEKSKTKDIFLLKHLNDGSIEYSVDHLFPRRGRFAVHIVINGSYVATWDVIVI